MPRAARWRSPLALAGVIACAVALAACGGGDRPRPTEPPVGRPGLAVGVAANAVAQDIPVTVGEVAAMDVRWMREEARWKDLEPRRGRFAYTRFDRLMVATARRGIHVLPLLYGSPAWTGAASENRFPPRLDEWGAFVGAVVARYSPGGAFWRAHPELDERLAPRWWEVWNEAYLREFSQPRPDPARYVRVLRAAVEAGRRASPDARFLASTETTYAGRDGRLTGWLAGMHDADPRLGDVLDGLAIHPYGEPGPFGVTGPFPFTRIGRFEAILGRLGIPRKPLWITEMGWSTCSARPPCLTPAEQARSTRQALELVAGRYRDVVDAYFTFAFGDNPYARADDVQGSYGLVGTDGRRKPAWAVVREAARQSP